MKLLTNLSLSKAVVVFFVLVLITLILLTIFLSISIPFKINSAEKVELMKTNWTFKGLFGKFDRASLQRGYQVYT